MRRILYIFISLAVLSITFSCTPQKRLSRLVTLHPELTIADTIKINDTVITTQIRIDTAFHQSTLKDTVTIEKEKLKLQIVEIRDTIYVEAQVVPDTIVIEREIPVEKIILQAPTVTTPSHWDKSAYQLFIILILLAVLAGIVLRIGKLIK